MNLVSLSIQLCASSLNVSNLSINVIVSGSSESGLILLGSRNLLTYVKLDSQRSVSMRSTEDSQNRPEFRDMVSFLSCLSHIVLQYFNKELRT